MDLWIPLTVVAAGVQAARTALQKHLTGRLSVLGVTFTRFFFGLPVILGGLAAYVMVSGQSLPDPNPAFIGFAWVGGLTQLLGNALLLHLLGMSNFTVGTTYTKTEVIQTAGVSFLVLGDRVEPGGLIGIVLAFFGVVIMATSKAGLSIASLIEALRHRPALYGLVVGGLYAVAAVFYRGAALALEDGGFVLRALTTLAWVTAAQVVFMALWLSRREPGVIFSALRAWPMGIWIGLTGIVASACWYTAFTLQNASYVMALGQIELVFAYGASRLVFKERMTLAEAVSVSLTIAGILAVVLLG